MIARLFKVTSFVTFFLVLLALPSCKRIAVQHRYKQMVEHEVVMPQGMTLLSERFVNPFGKTDRIVVWFDAHACSTCEVKRLNGWTSVLDSFGEEAPDPIFVFSCPEDLRDEFETTIANMEYDFSIWADYQNEFELNNKQIPADSRYHTFVIDSTNNVVLIGNPVYNKKIRQLYQSYFKQ